MSQPYLIRMGSDISYYYEKLLKMKIGQAQIEGVNYLDKFLRAKIQEIGIVVPEHDGFNKVVDIAKKQRIITKNKAKRFKDYAKIRNLFAHETECETYDDEPIKQSVSDFFNQHRNFCDRQKTALIATGLDGYICDNNVILMIYMLSVDIAAKKTRVY